jgi:hypothetical protein
MPWFAAWSSRLLVFEIWLQGVALRMVGSHQGVHMFPERARSVTVVSVLNELNPPTAARQRGRAASPVAQAGCLLCQTDGAPTKHHAAITGSQIAHPNDDVATNGTMGFP